MNSAPSKFTKILTQSYEIWNDEDFLRKNAPVYLSDYRDGLDKIDYDNIRKYLGMTADEVSDLSEVELARAKVNGCLAELELRLVSKDAWSSHLQESCGDRNLAMINVVRLATNKAPISLERWNHNKQRATQAVEASIGSTQAAISVPKQLDGSDEGPSIQTAVDDGRLWLVILVVSLAFVAFAFWAIRLMDKSPRQSIAVPAAIPPPVQTKVSPSQPAQMSSAPQKLEWFQGGTLHDATLAEWVRADSRNQLATAADWAARMAKDKGIRVNSMSELLLPSYEIQNCLRTGTIKEPGVSAAAWERVMRTTKAVEGAALCITLLESLPGSHFAK